MEFHVQTVGALPDLERILDAIQQVDPSAVMDIDEAGQVLRVAAAVDLSELLELLGQGGFPVGPEKVYQLPSICCGGCSG